MHSARTERRRPALAFAGAGVVAAGAVALIASVDPNEPGHYPTCPFLWATGLYCPGCGALRTVHALAHGDVMTALERNPLAVVLLPFVVFAWVMWGLRIAGVTIWRPTLIPVRWIWTLLVAILGFWVLRNVPGWTWLSPL